MIHELNAFLALDQARRRTDEANRYRLAAIASAGQPPFSARMRRLLARGLATLSIGSAAIARRLDRCIADDLGRTLSATE